MRTHIIEFLKSVADLVLPRICFHCGERFGDTPYPICIRCQNRIPPQKDPVCYLCGAQRAKFKDKGRCHDCPTGTVHFESLISVTQYRGVAKFVVEKLKYDQREEYAPFMADTIAKLIGERVWDKRFDIMVPVPLFHARQRERGFNQSLLIAKSLQEHYDHCEVVNALKRIRATQTQTRLSRSERKKNILGAFTCTNSSVITGKRILLVDDVGTTCSTLNECSRILMENGAAEVRCAVFAKAGLH